VFGFWVTQCNFHTKDWLCTRKALDFFGGIQQSVASWSKQHAFVDHLIRAAESMLFNLVEGVRLHPTEKKALTARKDYPSS